MPRAHLHAAGCPSGRDIAQELEQAAQHAGDPAGRQRLRPRLREKAEQEYGRGSGTTDPCRPGPRVIGSGPNRRANRFSLRRLWPGPDRSPRH
ncbi:DUF6381 family protein [Streptomyces nojiriensis]|uniref:DUF6381 family protein n=1 Tax=Streptomyces nojiriensis TaxID=66374 RepID=UPI001E353F6D|nr:DUF6381 family protein [Streptomyces nojiriensis]